MKQNTHIAKIYNKTMTLHQQNNVQKTIEFLEEIEASNMGPPGLGTPQIRAPRARRTLPPG